MYRASKDYEGREIGEVETSITVEKSLPQLKEFLLSADHASEILGNTIDIEPVGKGGFAWSFDGPLLMDFQGKGTITSTNPTTVIWKAQDQDSHALELRMDLKKAGNGTKIKLSCVFDSPGKAITNTLLQLLGGGPESLARTMLSNLKMVAEGNHVMP